MVVQLCGSVFKLAALFVHKNISLGNKWSCENHWLKVITLGILSFLTVQRLSKCLALSGWFMDCEVCARLIHAPLRWATYLLVRICPQI